MKVRVKWAIGHIYTYITYIKYISHISHIYDINRPRPMDTNIVNIKSASVWWCLYVLSNTKATFEAQFRKKLSSVEAELKKSVAYKKSL